MVQKTRMEYSINQKDIKRFFSKIRKTGGCWYWKTGKYIQRQIANKFNISRPYVSELIHKHKWKHI